MSYLLWSAAFFASMFVFLELMQLYYFVNMDNSQETFLIDSSNVQNFEILKIGFLVAAGIAYLASGGL